MRFENLLLKLAMRFSNRQDQQPVRNTDDLVPHANRLLSMAAKGAWTMTRILAGIAIRIPGWFVRMNRRTLSRPQPMKAEDTKRN